MGVFSFTTDKERFRLRSAGLNFAPMALFFVIEAICALTTPNYSYVLHDISFLGFTACFDAIVPGGGVGQLCPNYNLLFNAALIIAAIAQILGLATSRPLWPKNRRVQGALATLGVGAVLLFLVGAFPWNVQPSIHTLSASSNFLVTGIGLVVLGWGIGLHSRFGKVTLGLGVLSLVGLVLYTLGGGPVRGIVERLAAYPQIIWYSGLGVFMLRSARRAI